MNRSRKTGFPAVEEKNIKGELTIIDAGTIAKISIQSKRVLTSMLGKIKDASIPWLSLIHISPGFEFLLKADLSPRIHPMRTVLSVQSLRLNL